MTDKPREQIEIAPDPDEDDLDDLDDVLDEFNAQPKPAPKPATTQPKSAPPQHGLPKDDDLAAQLQAGVADLMGELDSNPEMQKEFERMMAELVQASQAPSDAEAIEHIGRATEAVHLSDDAPAAAGAAKKAASQQESFQDTVRKTMERMQASGASADAAAAASDGPSSAEEDMMAQLMKELQAGDGGGGEEEFNKMLMGMMSQLTNKEILYEPMKELYDKFPAWLEENKSKTGKEDLGRYEEQHAMVKQIVERFEKKGYSDDNEDDREYIVERMQRMQAAGSPPPDLVGDMSAAQEALGELEGGCPTQ